MPKRKSKAIARDQSGADSWVGFPGRLEWRIHIRARETTNLQITKFASPQVVAFYYFGVTPVNPGVPIARVDLYDGKPGSPGAQPLMLDVGQRSVLIQGKEIWIQFADSTNAGEASGFFAYLGS